MQYLKFQEPSKHLSPQVAVHRLNVTNLTDGYENKQGELKVSLREDGWESQAKICQVTHPVFFKV